jgi:adenine phosphoribosyltransferase
VPSSTPDPTLDADLRAALRDIPDFPQAGILFKDITPVLHDVRLFARVVDALARDAAGADLIVGIESRGFLFGTPVALKLGLPFAPFRKPGKLPYKTVEVSYDLEYGSAKLQAHVDALGADLGRPTRVVIVDDVLATGGTAAAAASLVAALGGEVHACVFPIELGFLGGRARLGGEVRSLVSF